MRVESFIFDYISLTFTVNLLVVMFGSYTMHLCSHGYCMLFQFSKEKYVICNANTNKLLNFCWKLLNINGDELSELVGK